MDITTESCDRIDLMVLINMYTRAFFGEPYYRKAVDFDILQNIRSIASKSKVGKVTNNSGWEYLRAIKCTDVWDSGSTKS